MVITFRRGILLRIICFYWKSWQKVHGVHVDAWLESVIFHVSGFNQNYVNIYKQLLLPQLSLSLAGFDHSSH